GGWSGSTTSAGRPPSSPSSRPSAPCWPSGTSSGSWAPTPGSPSPSSRCSTAGSASWRTGCLGQEGDPMISFVTGATGFIGGRLVDSLVEVGHDVRVLVRDPARATALARPGVEGVQGDLADAAGLAGALSGASRVFHCAGLVGDWLDTDEARRGNVEGHRALVAPRA